MIQIVAVWATPETVVEVNPQTISANLGERFTVNITVIEVQNLYGIEVSLRWNSSILDPVNVDIRLGQTDGVLHSPPPVYIVENLTKESEYVLAATSMNPAPSFNGSGNIVSITFNVTNPGDSELDLETRLWDYPPPNEASSPIDHTTIDSSVCAIIPEIPSTTVLLIIIILTTLILVLSKKVLRKPSRSQHQQLESTLINVRKVTEEASWQK
jgi:hypothetical protein